MIDLNKVKEFFDNDRFVKACDIEIKEAKEGYCECVMQVGEKHLNAGNVIQGGAIYTLCDFTFAVAANCDGRLTVTQNADITYIKAGKGKSVKAVANKISSGKSTCLYEVKVYDEAETVIAYATFNGFIKEKENRF